MLDVTMIGGGTVSNSRPPHLPKPPSSSALVLSISTSRVKDPWHPPTTTTPSYPPTTTQALLVSVLPFMHLFTPPSNKTLAPKHPTHPPTHPIFPEP